MNHNMQCKKTMCFIILWLCLIQGLFFAAKRIAFSCMEETLYTRSMTTMISMILVFIVISVYCQRNQHTMSVFPPKFRPVYLVITVIAAIFYAITLFLVKGLSIQSFLMLFYGSMITPVFEELLFRGLIWNGLNSCFTKESKTYAAVTLLFALWHIGYAIGIYAWNGGNLLNCIIMKVMMGAGYGLVTGAIRYKTKNCYLGIMVHGILNAL